MDVSIFMTFATFLIKFKKRPHYLTRMPHLEITALRIELEAIMIRL